MELLESKTIHDFQENGVVHLQGLLTDWIPALRLGVEYNIQHASKRALRHRTEHGSGIFLEDFCNWDAIPAYREFVLNSPLGNIAAELMQSQTVQFFHDHLLYKEVGSGLATPWHQDIPYYCVNSPQTVSFWIPLEYREKNASLRCAAGSHRLDKEIRPTSWSNNESFYANDSQFMDIPDIDSGLFPIHEWEMQVGDAIAFDFRVIHGANANTSDTPNRTLSFRLLGDNALYRDRGGRTSPHFPDINQQNGEPLREDWFPQIYPRPNPTVENRETSSRQFVGGKWQIIKH